VAYYSLNCTIVGRQKTRFALARFSDTTNATSLPLFLRIYVLFTQLAMEVINNFFSKFSIGNPSEVNKNLVTILSVSMKEKSTPQIGHIFLLPRELLRV
jgi:hypothetical protein